MNDETPIVPVDGSVEAQPESTQTPEAVVTQTQAPAPLSLQDVERLVSEREGKLRAEFDERERKNKSKSDKAYAAAMRDAKVIEQNAEVLGLDADQVSAAKRKIIDRTFDTAFTEPTEPETPAPNYAPQPNLYVNEQEILAALASEGLKPADVDYKDLLGQLKSDALMPEWNERVTLAKAAQIQSRRNTQAAAPIAQVARTTGGLGSPQGGAPSAGVDPKAELTQLMTQEPPNDPISLAKYQQRIQELYAKVDGKW